MYPPFSTPTLPLLSQDKQEKQVSKRRQRNKRVEKVVREPEQEAAVVSNSAAPPSAPCMPDMDAIAAMRAQFQRPDGALDTKPPAFGEL